MPVAGSDAGSLYMITSCSTRSKHIRCDLQFVIEWQFGAVVAYCSQINVVALCPARLVLAWVNIHGFELHLHCLCI